LVPDGPWKQAVIIALLAALIILLGYIVQYLAATTATVQTFNARAQSFIHDQWNLGETDSTTIFSRLTRLYDLLRARKIDVLVTDRGDRYRIMANILDDKRCTAIFLIQASSSLLLGPGDDGAKEEKLFLDKLRERISSGVDFRYVVSLLGTTAHYRRWSNFRALAEVVSFCGEIRTAV
jgi:hypothetical protein